MTQRCWKAGQVLAAVAAFGALLAAPALAQVDCRALGRQIAAYDRGGPGTGEARRYAQAAATQQAEIDRTVAYGVSIGCWRQSFFSHPPAVCGQIDERLYRMRANLANLSSRALPGPRIGGVDRETLQLEYDAWCRGRRDAPRAARVDPYGAPPPGLRRVPIEELPPDDLPPDETGEAWPDSLPDPRPDEGERAGSSAICVRSCDGGYFPLTVKARAGKLTDLQELCTALCPNVEAKLYTLPAGGNVADAVNPAGEAYSRHPNAFLFRKKYDAACACKPAGKDWGQVLNEAEKIIDKETGGADRTVSPREAEALSKPVVPPAPGAAPGQPAAQQAAPTRRDRRNAAKPAPAPSVAPPPAAEAPAATPPAAARSAPATADPAQPGETKEVVGPDGVRRKVRIVGPKT